MITTTGMLSASTRFLECACLLASQRSTQALEDVQRLHRTNSGTQGLLCVLCRAIDIFKSLG